MVARRVLFGLILVMVCAAPVRAQAFQGRGPEATERFSLGEGVAVFDVVYRGDGAFLVKLVDDGGNVVGEVATGNGAFNGSGSVRIQRTGLYLIDVAASGEWSVRLRRNDVAPPDDVEPAENEQARVAGAAEASRVGTSGWLARGFLGGVLLGPIGTGFAIAKAGSSAEGSTAQAVAAATLPSPDYARAWEAAYLDRLRMRRQRSALIGGAVGSGVLLFALLQIVDVGGVSDDDPLGEPSASIVIPIRW